MAKSCLGVWSMSAAEGHEPPHVPHWMHIWSRESPGTAAITSWMKSWSTGPVATGAPIVSVIW